MALQADKTKDQRDAASIAAEARELFEEWASEEEAGYRGEVSWDEFKRDLNAGRPPHDRPFREDWLARVNELHPDRSVILHPERTYNQGMERTETKIDRVLIERARERARMEGREESELIEDALKRYLGEAEEETFGEILDGVATWQREHRVKPLSEEEAMKLAVEEQHAPRRGE